MSAPDLEAQNSSFKNIFGTPRPNYNTMTNSTRNWGAAIEKRFSGIWGKTKTSAKSLQIMLTCFRLRSPGPKEILFRKKTKTVSRNHAWMEKTSATPQNMEIRANERTFFFHHMCQTQFLLVFDIIKNFWQDSPNPMTHYDYQQIKKQLKHLLVDTAEVCPEKVFQPLQFYSITQNSFQQSQKSKKKKKPALAKKLDNINSLHIINHTPIEKILKIARANPCNKTIEPNAPPCFHCQSRITPNAPLGWTEQILTLSRIPTTTNLFCLAKLQFCQENTDKALRWTVP